MLVSLGVVAFFWGKMENKLLGVDEINPPAVQTKKRKIVAIPQQTNDGAERDGGRRAGVGTLCIVDCPMLTYKRLSYTHAQLYSSLARVAFEGG
jgi:hypothetical protein